MRLTQKQGKKTKETRERKVKKIKNKETKERLQNKSGHRRFYEQSAQQTKKKL